MFKDQLKFHLFEQVCSKNAVINRFNWNETQHFVQIDFIIIKTR